MSDLPGLRTCPVCEKEPRGHRYARLASIIDNPNDQSRADKFLKDIASRRWSEVLPINEWQGGADMFELYALRCPTSRLALIVVRSPFELFDDDHIAAIETLTTDESSTLAALIGLHGIKSRFDL
ncbi:MAG TPA: hypothetical protein VGD38_11005 [Pyrinomonadaceae bacterium]